jgi:uncharacterized hydrophobic protein (TIGR00271 family)
MAMTGMIEPGSAADNARGGLSGWRRLLIAGVEHETILHQLRADARLSGHFLFMTVMSAGIAILGLLLSSPAVVIGAMLISPLMGPIVGVGFALALFDFVALRRSVVALLTGIVVAVGFTAIVVALSPIQTVTSEIAARTRPNLFDLAVAILSGLAATYAMVRGRHGAIVGVAIAVAVMPPLAVVGFGLATGNLSILAGAAFLFFTNLMAIGLSAAGLARWYGFGHFLSPRQTWLQLVFIIGALAALAVPLAVVLRQIAWEAVATRQARDALAREFDRGARVAQFSLDFDRRPIRLSATVFTPRFQAGAETRAAAALGNVLGQPVELALDQVRAGGGEADAAQLASARDGVENEAALHVAELLAMVAGRATEDVLVDRARRVARVRATPIAGADFRVYRQLEARVAASAPDWTVLLVPPALASPVPAAREADPDRLALAAWVAVRLERPLRVSGEGAEAVAETLRAAGAQVVVGETGGASAIAWADAEN